MADPTNISEWRDKDVFLAGAGKKLGKLEDVYYDAGSDEPLFLCVRTGWISRKQVMVPVRDVIVSPDYLTLPWAKPDVDRAPTTRPGKELTIADEERVFRHYGMDYPPPDTPSGRRLFRR